MRDKKGILDLNVLIDDLDDADDAIEVCEAFVVGAKKRVDMLGKYCDVMTSLELQMEAHSIKGGALNVNAKSLAGVAKTIETLAKEQKHIQACALVARLKDEFAKVEYVFREIRGGRS